MTIGLKIRLSGAGLGGSCVIGSDEDPIPLSMTTGIKRIGRLPRPAELPPPTPEEQEFNEAALWPWFTDLIGEPSLVERQIQGWRLDAASLAKAVMRHSPDTPIARRPTRPAPGIARIATTAWEVRKNLQRLAERDEHRNNDQ